MKPLNVLKKYLTMISVILFPNKITVFFLNILGHKISFKAYVGFSLIFTEKIYMAPNSKINHFNIINIDKILLKEKAKINSYNRIKGPMYLLLGKSASITNKNIIHRAISPISYGISIFKLGDFSNIVSGNLIDCTRSVILGSNTTIAGIGSQLWTHGYVHSKRGMERIRIDGEINIGNNVYIGSRSIINSGVKVNNSITVGSNSNVSKSLINEGLYVSQPLRYIEAYDVNIVKLKYKKITYLNQIEDVYEK